MLIKAISNKLTRLFLQGLLPIFLLAACGEQSGSNPENGKQKITDDTASLSPAPSPEESGRDDGLMDINWGREINLNDMIAIAREGRIKEIQWHMLPNILRAQAYDGEVFHIRNDNKSVDLRNTLIKAGVEIGEGGVLFRHVF